MKGPFYYGILLAVKVTIKDCQSSGHLLFDHSIIPIKYLSREDTKALILCLIVFVAVLNALILKFLREVCNAEYSA